MHRYEVKAEECVGDTVTHLTVYPDTSEVTTTRLYNRIIKEHEYKAEEHQLDKNTEFYAKMRGLPVTFRIKLVSYDVCEQCWQTYEDNNEEVTALHVINVNLEKENNQ